MKICFVVNSLKNRSGVERVLSLLANYFTKEGYEITVLNRDTNFDNVAFDLDKRVKVIALNGNILDFSKKIREHFLNNNYDVAIIHN
ncbi:glycosyltransferase family 4 protein, partial [Acinetobacter baumannii]|nr:glycosyltransferase family 4 protein [Acinetobacter baumannii]